MTTLKDLLGTSYKEGMTFEEIDAVLSAKTLIDPEKAPVVSKEVFDKTSSELAQLKKEIKDLKGKNLSAEEMVAQALQEAAEAKSTYQKESAKVKAVEVLVQIGLTEADYGKLLPSIVSENIEETVARASSLAEMIKNQRSAVEQQVRTTLMKETPKPPAGEAGANYNAQLQEAMESGDFGKAAALIRLQQTKPI